MLELSSKNVPQIILIEGKNIGYWELMMTNNTQRPYPIIDGDELAVEKLGIAQVTDRKIFGIYIEDMNFTRSGRIFLRLREYKSGLTMYDIWETEDTIFNSV